MKRAALCANGCGTPLAPKHGHRRPRFCTAKCRDQWHSRKANRGSKLIDVIAPGTAAHVEDALELIDEWRIEDRSARRESY